MRFVLTADVDAGVHRPGMPLAQVLREIEPVVEFASPLVNGRLTDRWSGVTRATWEVTPQALVRPSPNPVAEAGAAQFILTVDIPDDIPRPGLPIAQMLREIEPVIETMLPLVPGYLNDRLTGDVKAAWLVGIPLVTAPVITTFGPDPGPVGDGEFGFSITGNFFPDGAELYFDGVPALHTDVYSQWSITGGALMCKTPRVAKCMLVCSGLGYAHFDWTFAEALPEGPVFDHITPNPTPVAIGNTLALDCHGSNFTAACVIWLNGVAMPTTLMASETPPYLRTGTLSKTEPGPWPVFIRTPGFPDTPPIDWVFEVAAEASHTG